MFSPRHWSRSVSFKGRALPLAAVPVLQAHSATLQALPALQQKPKLKLGSSTRCYTNPAFPQDQQHSFYDGSTLLAYALQPITPISLQELLRWSEKPRHMHNTANTTNNTTHNPPLPELPLHLQSAQFVAAELPKRLARRVQALQQLPYIVGINPHIRRVYRLYLDSFDKIRRWQPSLLQTPDDDRRFTEMLAELVESHAEVIPVLARGIHECRRYLTKPEITRFLDGMISARIGIRVLAEHHIALHQNRDNPTMNGILNLQCSPYRILARAAPFAQELTELHYGTFPEFVVDGHVDTRFPYMDVHLEYMLFELLKNAFRATVECSRKLGRAQHPPVQITIGTSQSDVTVRIRDCGGGIPAAKEKTVFEYSYTTVDEEEQSIAESADSIFTSQTKLGVVQGTGGPMAGLGYGLPMTRMYAEWVGGSLQLVSLYGHGCDVFLRIPHIESISQPVNV